MNLIEQARDLSQKIPDLRKLQDEKHKQNQYAAHRDKLENITTVLVGLAAIAEELRARGGDVTGFKTSAQGVLLETRRVATKFAEDENVIIDPLLAQTFWPQLEGMPGKVRRVLEKKWSDYVTSKIPSGQTEILTVLSRVPGFNAQTSKVSQYRADMSDLGRGLPQDGDFQRLEELARQVEQAWSELHGDGLPESVLEFLKKAHTIGFSLADLDNEVLDWLNTQELLGKYKVRDK